jgi:hypothetical protein
LGDVLYQAYLYLVTDNGTYEAGETTIILYTEGLFIFNKIMLERSGNTWITQLSELFDLLDY